MKIVLLLLAALAGLAVGANFPLSYEYQYTGEVKTGIHELRDQYAGVLLTATVRVSVVSSSEANIQIVNPQVGTMNGEVPQSGRARLPVGSLSPLHDKAALEQSFKLYFSGQQEKLQVPKGELLWISNLRKSIASLLRVPFVLSSPVISYADTIDNKIRSSTDIPKSFKKREHTIHGECVVTYTLTKAAPSFALSLKELSEDAQHPSVQLRPGQEQRQQRRSGSLSNSVYRMHRSVDFYDCADRVVLEKASHGNFSMAGTGQLRGLQSRSSVGEYLLTGEPSSEFSMRIEQAVVEGVVTMNPFGHETKKMMTITNQTLSLVKTTKSQIVRSPSSQLQDETWSFRVESPYKRSPDSPSWVTFKEQEDSLYPMYPEKDLTGFRLTPKLREQIKSEIRSELDVIVHQVRQPNKLVTSAFGGSVDGEVVQKLESVVSRLRGLPVSDVRELYTSLVEEQSSTPSMEQVIKKELVISALKASGSGACIKVLLQKIREGRISPIETANIFVSMMSNVANPAIISDLIDYAVEIPENAPVSLKSSVLINLSSLVRRHCIKSTMKTFDYPKEMIGQSRCSHESVFGKFIPYLQKQLKSTSETYLRSIYIQSLANIGDISCVKTLGEIAEGVLLRKDNSLRVLAIQGLSKNHLQNSSYPFVQDVLLSVADEQTEDASIREAAIASLFTLPQNASFWQRMSQSTWREPSPRVASFIYSVIRAVANSKNPHFITKISMAKHVLPLAKPQPVSPYYSGMFLSSSYSPQEDLSATLESLYLSGTSSIIPQHFAAKALTVLGGMKIPLIHFSAISNDLDYPLWSLLDKLRGLPESRHASMTPNYRKSIMGLEESTESHQSSSSSKEEKSLFAHLTVLKNMEIFAPFTSESTKQLSEPSKSLLASIFQKLQTSEPIQGLTYYNPVDVTEIMPSDIGLPIITQVSRPSFIYTEVVAKLSSSPNPLNLRSLFQIKYINVTGHAITKVVLKSETSMKVLVPWSNDTVIVGIDGETTFSLPAEFFVALDRRSPQKIVQYGIKPQNLPVSSPVMMSRVLPFTLVRPLFPAKDVTQQQVKPIHVVNNSPYYRTELKVPKEKCGLDVSLRFEGDIEFPFNTTTITQSIIEPLRLVKLLVNPSTRQHQMSLLYSPQSSSIREFIGTLTYVNLQRSSPSTSNTEAPTIENLSADDTMEQRLQKLAKSSVPVVSMYSASLNLTGTKSPSKYEMVLLTHPTTQLSESPMKTLQRQFQINLMSSSSGSSPSSDQICVSSSLQYPVLTPLMPLSEILRAPLTTALLSKIYSGEICSKQNQYLLIKGSQQLSGERRTYLENALNRGEQDLPIDQTEAVKSAAVYDRLNFEVDYSKKTLSPRLQNITNHIRELVHGVLFPLIQHNSIDVHGQEGLIIVNGTRSLASDRYTIWTHSPTRVCLTRDLKVPSILDYVSPLNGYLRRPSHPLTHRSQLLETPTSNMCLVESTRVRTMAGVMYSKVPITCQQIAVKGESGDNDRFVILTEQVTESPTSEQEIKIIYPKDALTVVIRKLEILVNEQRISEAQKEVKSAAGVVIARVTQSQGSKMVKIPGRFSVRLSGEGLVSIKMDERYRSKVNGLCGRFRSEKMGDLRDSKGCLYSENDGSYYSAAWIASSEYEQCKSRASQSLKKIIEDFERYQQHCPKALHEQARQRRPHH